MLNLDSIIIDEINFKFHHLKSESEKGTAVLYLKAKR